MVLKLKTEEDRIDEDFLWLGRNMPSLQKDYEESWIAVIDKCVVGFGEDAKEAYSKAKQKFPDKEPLLNFIPKKRLIDMFEIHFRNLDKETCFILTKTNKEALNPKERL